MKTPRRWLQVQGDPSIRGFLFDQSRVTSAFDDNVDQVLDTVETLILRRGVFHINVHFSSGQMSLWLFDDPYNYQVVLKDEVLGGNLLDDYPQCPYPGQAMISPKDISAILLRFKQLRAADPVIYLRTGSLNIINGSISLNFSCDGYHYVDYEEFLTNDNYSPG